MGYASKLLDTGTMEGGLVRMIERFKNEGTLIGEAKFDQFIMDTPNAALLGMLFDQRVRAEYAFAGPHRLWERLGHLDFNKIAKMSLEDLATAFGEKPAVHRFTNVMAERTHQIAIIVVEKYDGKAENMWNQNVDFPTIQKRLIELSGFGPMTASKMKYVLHYFGYRDFS